MIIKFFFAYFILYSVLVLLPVAVYAYTVLKFHCYKYYSIHITPPPVELHSDYYES